MALSVKCSDVGGKCDEVISGANKAELMTNLKKHVDEAHPEMAAEIDAMSPEQMEAWDKDTLEPKLAGQMADGEEAAAEAPAEEAPAAM